MRIPRVAYENHVRRMLMADFELSFDDVLPDLDGDWSVMTEEGVRVFVRLLYDVEDCAWVRVWAQVADGLRPTAKVLREVNEINQRHIGTRVLLTDDGILVAAAELIAGSFEEGDLGILVGRVAETVTDVGQLVQLVHGNAPVDEVRREAGTT